MGDEGDYWREHRDWKAKRKRAYKRNELPKDFEILDRLGVKQEMMKGGEHYVLKFQTDRGWKTVDWWPSTGYWKDRKGRAKGRRIQHLKNYYKLTDSCCTTSGPGGEIEGSPAGANPLGAE